MADLPNPQQRITHEIGTILKARNAPMSPLWDLWFRERDRHPDEFVMVLIGELVATSELAKLRASKQAKAV